MIVVVTGGAGFIGSHLSEALLAAGAIVHVIDNLSSGYRANIPSGAVLHETDIRSPEARSLIAGIRPEAVYHLAAQADVQRSLADPAEDASVNVKGTLNMLKASSEAGVRKFVFASTSAVYGNVAKDVVSEREKAEPMSFYGLSKRTAEQYIRIYSHLYGLDYTILRYGNVYGPRQTPKGEGGVVAVFLDRLRRAVPPTVHGDGEQTRDFVYVKDIVAANLAAFARGARETLNVGTGRATSVNELLRLLEQCRGAPIACRHAPARAGDIRHSRLDPRRARRVLRWESVYDTAAGIAETYASTLPSSR
ncbi:NAD-dependent epimerase/dehydratase family protein [Cohnella hashimotonis]|uniref:NAD-dependent epimerase/dehydratase family protein n=1 Tax=Cohnella hashimotonis TaxID=2826895 RepID=A0ABT6TGP6_9BACL|nr:NAD-dependent epimerase/dehydratase family protein [Cohnella hashimotonis]MDI4646009.1 NAD-dependent epimerase/dehydratase family protein [Cohnella hashimotonis]